MLPASATGPGWRAGSADGLEGVHLGPSGVLVLEPEGVDGGVVGPLGGQRVFREDRGHGALGLAGPAVDALVGIDEQLAVGAGVEVDAIDGADGHAGLVDDVDARFGDDVGHRAALLGYRGLAGPPPRWPAPARAHDKWRPGCSAVTERWPRA